MKKFLHFPHILKRDGLTRLSTSLFSSNTFPWATVTQPKLFLYLTSHWRWYFNSKLIQRCQWHRWVKTVSLGNPHFLHLCLKGLEWYTVVHYCLTVFEFLFKWDKDLWSFLNWLSSVFADPCVRALHVDDIQNFIFTDSAVSTTPISFDLVVSLTPLSHDSTASSALETQISQRMRHRCWKYFRVWISGLVRDVWWKQSSKSRETVPLMPVLKWEKSLELSLVFMNWSVSLSFLRSPNYFRHYLNDWWRQFYWTLCKRDHCTLWYCRWNFISAQGCTIVFWGLMFSAYSRLEVNRRKETCRCWTIFCSHVLNSVGDLCPPAIAIHELWLQLLPWFLQKFTSYAAPELDSGPLLLKYILRQP